MRTAASYLSRRSLLTGAGALGLTSLAPALAAGPSPFTLGVASGDPWPDGFVIWTRLAPEPLAADGSGGIKGPVPVRWQVAEDPGMTRVVRQGQTVARDAFAHAVHVEVAGLKPGRPYWHRFTALGEASRTGMARTAPAAGQAASRLRLAIASCSHWESGYFSAYRHMAEEDPDLVLFLGDYIYEYDLKAADKRVRVHGAPEPTDLAGYRNRHALYKTDPDLQALHAAAPCAVTWDDHEVENDYSNRWSEDPAVAEADFLRRRAAAYRAFWEHMPLRRSSLPSGPDMRLYRRLAYGDLAQIMVLDGRQYRTPQACNLPGSRHGRLAPDSCAERLDPARSMLGMAQERWLGERIRGSEARWNLFAQDMLVAEMRQRDSKSGEMGHWNSGWDGYPATRERLLGAISGSGLANPVFFGGDIHSYWANDLKADFRDPGSHTVATEFVGTSITSDGPPHDAFAPILALNPHVKFFDSRPRGYIATEITPGLMQTRFRTISDRRDPAATVSTLKSFVVESGRAGPVDG